MRARVIMNAVNALRVNRDTKTAVAMWRNRAVQRWHATQRGDGKEDGPALKVAGVDEEDGRKVLATVQAWVDHMHAEQESRLIASSTAAQTKERNADAFVAESVATVTRLMGESDEVIHVPAAAGAPATAGARPRPRRADAVHHMAFASVKEMKKLVFADTANLGVGAGVNPVVEKGAAAGAKGSGVRAGDAGEGGGGAVGSVDEAIAQLATTLNEGQERAVRMVCDWAVEDRGYREDSAHNAAPEPLCVLIHGGAGVGKSVTARAIVAAVDALTGCAVGNSAVQCSAPTGVAASLLPMGRTVHDMLSLGAFVGLERLKPLTGTKLAVARARFTNTRVVLIDEVSMITTAVLAHISDRLQQIGGDERPFGGYAVVFVGDFFQLPPVDETRTLFKGVVQMAQEHESGAVGAAGGGTAAAAAVTKVARRCKLAADTHKPTPPPTAFAL
jgi:hypothetical protein